MNLDVPRLLAHLEAAAAPDPRLRVLSAGY
jgi:hypothetical protein